MLFIDDLFYPVVALATTVSAATLMVYLTFPVLLLQFYFRFSVMYSGMKLNYIEIEGLRICYGEKGVKKKGHPSMLLLHGFTADKFMWVPFVKNVTRDTHVIAVDLPGHGYSDPPTEEHDISHMASVTKLHTLIQKLGLHEQRLHVVGMSMGGSLAGLYTAEYPEHVWAVTLICPAMKTPNESPLWVSLREAIEAGVEDVHEVCNMLFPMRAEEVQEMLDFVQYHKLKVPKKILQGVADLRKPFYPFFTRLFKTITHPDMHGLLERRCGDIKAPSQIIWGEKDQVIDVSGAEALRQKLPNCCKVDIIPRCGHSMTIDRPGAMTKAILEFRKQLLVNT